MLLNITSWTVVRIIIRVKLSSLSSFEANFGGIVNLFTFRLNCKSKFCRSKPNYSLNGNAKPNPSLSNNTHQEKQGD